MRRIKKLSRAKRVCERLVNRNKISYAIIANNKKYLLMKEDKYKNDFKTEDGRQDPYLVKIQAYYGYEVTEEDIEKAAILRKKYNK